MYARLVLAELSIYPDTLKRVEPVLKALKTALGKVKGLQSYTLFHDWAKGEVGLLAVWDSSEAEQKAWGQIKGKLDGARDVMWKGRPTFKLYDVYEHGPSSKPTRREPIAAKKTSPKADKAKPKTRSPKS